jgi:hypothetical protein
LIFHALINRNESLESRSFRCSEKLTIFESGEAGISRCLAVMSRQSVAESLIDTFVNQDAHFLLARKKKFFRLFQGGEGGCARNGGKSGQKHFEGLSAFEIVEKRLHRYAGPTKYGRATKNLRVFDDNAHEEILARLLERPSIQYR